MFKTWTASHTDPADVARALEGHLNEHAQELLSVGYSIAGGAHYVLAVYRPIEIEPQAAAGARAEEIVGEAQG